MQVFLTSDIGASEKIDGRRVVARLNNTNGFADNLKKSIKGNHLMVFVASSPFFDGTEDYANLTRNSLALDGMVFDEMIVLDGKNSEKCEELMKRADLVFLAGGDTAVQIKFFEKMELSLHIRSCAGVVVGQSAGALNLAEEVYCSPTPDESATEKYWKGLGLTKIRIEPHFRPENKHLIDAVLLPDSKTKDFIAIKDGAYIVDDGKTQILYGEGWLFSGGQMTQINIDGKTKNISEFCKN